MTEACFHCGLPVPEGTHYRVAIEGAERPMCCPGCQAVAETIMAQGLGQYYQLRTETSIQGRSLIPEELAELDLLDRADLQADFVERQGEQCSAALSVEGITCAACVWLIERRLTRLPGIIQVGVNSASHRLHLRWHEGELALSEVLRELARLGYHAYPFESEQAEAREKRAERQFLGRLGVAGLGMMQAMMYAANLYAGPESDIAPAHEHFLRLVGLIVTLPVVSYSAWPFYVNAWRNLRHRHLVMDLPVSIAILLAFFASAWAALVHTGEIYFDSVTMFVFFLLIGRYLERRARLRAHFALAGQRRMLPRKATRLRDDGEEQVLSRDLAVGDRIRVKPGETLSIDGRVMEGRSSVNEALLTGEPIPVAKAPGDRVIAGSINVDGPLLVQVEEVGNGTAISALMRLQDQAQAEKPRIAEFADRIAGVVVLALLLSAAATWLVWQFVAPGKAFWVTLSVLVVTCPCALSLATPVALTNATSALARRGLLIARGHALETLARVSHVVMDKTGTLTEGRLRVLHTEPLRDFSEEHCLRLAAALESASGHPIARAFSAYRSDEPVSEAEASTGMGIAGVVAGEYYRIGQAAFVAGLSGPCPARAGHPIYLGDRHGPLAVFQLGDVLRPEAPELVRQLAVLGIELELLSGDASEAPGQLAAELGITRVNAGASPDDKLRRIRELQAGGACVLMVGDGVNDAPVLAGADVSIAMGAGADLAKTSADMILLNNHLERVLEALLLARRTRRIIRENMGWALAYNVIALPAAALGWVAPWLAAAGMSASSLLVVLNALRLNRATEARSRSRPLGEPVR